jgi:hypothetical protein
MTPSGKMDAYVYSGSSPDSDFDGSQPLKLSNNPAAVASKRLQIKKRTHDDICLPSYRRGALGSSHSGHKPHGEREQHSGHKQHSKRERHSWRKQYGRREYSPCYSRPLGHKNHSGCTRIGRLQLQSRRQWIRERDPATCRHISRNSM